MENLPGPPLPPQSGPPKEAGRIRTADRQRRAAWARQQQRGELGRDAWTVDGRQIDSSGGSLGRAAVSITRAMEAALLLLIPRAGARIWYRVHARDQGTARAICIAGGWQRPMS